MLAVDPERMLEFLESLAYLSLTSPNSTAWSVVALREMLLRDLATSVFSLVLHCTLVNPDEAVPQ